MGRKRTAPHVPDWPGCRCAECRISRGEAGRLAWPGTTAEATNERLKQDQKKLSRKNTPAGTRQLTDELQKIADGVQEVKEAGDKLRGGPVWVGRQRPVAEDSGDPFGFVAGVAAEPAASESDREKRKGVKLKAAPALTDQDKTTYSPVED